jgi:hypothetical protein
MAIVLDLPVYELGSGPRCAVPAAQALSRVADFGIEPAGKAGPPSDRVPAGTRVSYWLPLGQRGSLGLPPRHLVHRPELQVAGAQTPRGPEHLAEEAEGHPLRTPPETASVDLIELCGPAVFPRPPGPERGRRIGIESVVRALGEPG